MRVDLWAEFNAARSNMSADDRALLVEHGVAPGDCVLLCGVARIRLDKRRELYEPDELGANAFLTPVMLEWLDTPESTRPAQAVRFGELVDLVAWHPAHPEAWALRMGAASWLGAIEPQYADPAPVLLHSGVCGWLRSRGQGLLPLCREPMELYLLLTRCRRLQAQDQAHATALRRSLRPPWPPPPVACIC